ncbi:MAG: PQQ-binding-like beta-propeller repeat protein [Prosthecobacter sp.]|jgi:outer membrane protein assembly factor BamB|uniref:PQQ-like beta-propeller repeat protein n=1 Tax=Prosthecobacter sp. TaxID=1965333 RepID=UPI0019F76BA7|nr:PQQ-like beta-propeller repeat protein [Prosthecobacter sp.]MBE2283996.1 PQQ-binding-like beta-propeller repeat protein [Prosthecobacter sp.]
MHPPRTTLGCLFAILALTGISQANDWTNWRGPLQNGVSLEHYKGAGKLSETPAWTYDARGRGTAVVFDGKVILWGYKGETTDLIELITCMDAKTGKKLWEHELPDYLSDSIYNRYSIGAPTVDPETKRIYLVSNAGTFYCWEIDGSKVFELNLMEDLGRMTFPNARVGSPVIEGDYVMTHFIYSNWGADGPAADRIYGFDKKTGELVWWSLPGVNPPVDSSFSTPVLETRDGKRVAYFTTGCGHVVCVNARNGKPYWKMPICKNGVNPSVVLHKGNLIAIHNDENVDSSEKGRLVCIKLPEKLTAAVPPATDSTVLEPSAEVWRNPIGATSSSPVLVGDVVYQLTDGAELYAIDANTGADLWKLKLSNANLHSSPLYVDGLIYCPLMEGKLVVVKPGDKAGEVVQEIKLEGSCLGAPSVCDGMLYVTTTEKFYAFAIPNAGITVDAAPKPEIPAAGKAVALQVIPAEVAIMAGDKQAFRIRSVDANGMIVSEDVKGVKWETFIPPTAKVKATMDAKFNDAGELVVAPDAKISAGAFKGTGPDGLFGIIRGRALKNLPITEDFESYELADEFPADANNNPPYKFAYPPLSWIGARFKFQVMEKDGSKVFGKSFDRLLFQRATVFVAPSHMKNYTMQADVMTDGSARSKSDIGLVNQRYLICLRGNAGKLEVSSNLERLKQEAPFKMTANKWYTLKTRVDVAGDGSGVVKAKVWEKGGAEPDAWTIEVKVPRAHQHGSPGIFGFTPLNQRRVFLDNLSITPNK